MGSLSLLMIVTPDIESLPSSIRYFGFRAQSHFTIVIPDVDSLGL